MRPTPRAPAGTYYFTAGAPGAYPHQQTYNSSTGARRARIPIDVGRGDLEGLTLSAVPDVSLKGHIVSDSDGPPLPLSSVRVSLQPREFDGFSGGTAVGRPDEGGHFEIAHVPADRYLLSVSGLPSGAYVKAARTEQADVLASGLDLSGGGAPGGLAIVVSPRGATVSGNIQSAGAVVVLIPRDKDRRDQPYFHKSAVADQKGAFSIAGVPPGDYKLYAWEEAGGEAWLDPDFVRPFESKGEPVTLREGEQKTVSLQAIPAAN
jgi:hypothetical protein